MPAQRSEISNYLKGQSIPRGPIDWKLGEESFVVSSLALNPDEAPPVTMLVMKSYDEATAFLNHLRRLLLAVGLGAVFVGSLLVYITAKTFTRPLEELVDGVRALGKGDFRYPVEARGASEIAELTNAFSGMRESLHQAQQRLLEAERLATIGRMASSISHDLRHPLTAVLANAEFLADADLSPHQREELYLEIRIAVNRLTDLVDSLLELSRPADSLNVVEAPIERTISRAIELVRAHPQFHKITVGIESSGLHFAQFDQRKMERVFYNLLLNGCQAAQTRGGHVAVNVTEVNGNLEIRTTDDGPGVESSLRDKLFQPFVSHGKENGTGLGPHDRAEDRAGPRRHLTTGKFGTRTHGHANRAAADMQEDRHMEWPNSWTPLNRPLLKHCGPRSADIQDPGNRCAEVRHEIHQVFPSFAFGDAGGLRVGRGCTGRHADDSIQR